MPENEAPPDQRASFHLAFLHQALSLLMNKDSRLPKDLKEMETKDLRNLANQMDRARGALRELLESR